jgi:hypothetical protein
VVGLSLVIVSNLNNLLLFEVGWIGHRQVKILATVGLESRKTAFERLVKGEQSDYH